MRKIPYVNAVGSLMHAMMCTILDIYYCWVMVSIFQTDLGMQY